MRDVHDQIRRVTPLVEAGHRHGVRVSVGINQISFAPEEYVATYSAAMHEAGAPEIMLYDGGSGMGPEAASTGTADTPHRSIASGRRRRTRVGPAGRVGPRP